MDAAQSSPIVVFADDGTGGKVRVARWASGTTWTDLGFVSSGAGSFLSMAVPSDNKPVVAFVDDASGHIVRVKKWSIGTSWTDMGSPSSIMACSTTIVIDPSDSKPVVALSEIPNGQGGPSKAHVMKWSSGTSWSDLGYPTFDGSIMPSLAIDPSDNKPIVALWDSWSDKPGFGGVHVMKWLGGTSWTGLGWPGPGPTSNGPCLAIDPSDNKPVVICCDSMGPDQKVWVSKHP